MGKEVEVVLFYYLRVKMRNEFIELLPRFDRILFGLVQGNKSPCPRQQRTHKHSPLPKNLTR